MRVQNSTPDYILDNARNDFPCVAIPNWLFDSEYAGLSTDAKLVYSLLLPPFYHSQIGEKIVQPDRAELINTIEYMLACRKRTAVKVLSELSNADLVTVTAA